MTPFEVHALGRVVGGRAEVEDDAWGSLVCDIVLNPAEVDADATAGLADFSHIEVVYLFDRVDLASICRGSRHPRGRADWPRVGILAQRAKDRPNRMGVTVCELRAVDGLRLTVAGLDAVDGTPVLDVKPYVAEFAPRSAVRQPLWVTELMRDYW